jgi:hypothetical protein
MKVGDKVILKDFESIKGVITFFSFLKEEVGNEVVVEEVKADCFKWNNGYWWHKSGVEPVKNERYFLFAYVYQGGGGSLTATNHVGEMPSYEYINSQVKVVNKLSCNIAITNIYEFKSKEDYEQFNRKGE